MNHTNTLIRYADRVNPRRLPCTKGLPALTRWDGHVDFAWPFRNPIT